MSTIHPHFLKKKKKKKKKKVESTKLNVKSAQYTK